MPEKGGNLDQADEMAWTWAPFWFPGGTVINYHKLHVLNDRNTPAVLGVRSLKSRDDQGVLFLKVLRVDPYAASELAFGSCGQRGLPRLADRSSNHYPALLSLSLLWVSLCTSPLPVSDKNTLLGFTAYSESR